MIEGIYSLIAFRQFDAFLPIICADSSWAVSYSEAIMISLSRSSIRLISSSMFLDRFASSMLQYVGWTGPISFMTICVSVIVSFFFLVYMGYLLGRLLFSLLFLCIVCCYILHIVLCGLLHLLRSSCIRRLVGLVYLLLL